MLSARGYTILVSLITALGGFLMGFDASVISGVVGFIEIEYALTELEVGWAVASLTLTSTLAMLSAGPLSERLGRRPVLVIAALLFLVSALASALAPNYWSLVAARMLGGLGVGAALIIAPMYIAEIAPTSLRGRLVSLNQLNIVIGISAAYFSNYLLLQLSKEPGSLIEPELLWRWMLGAEMIPAIIYLAALKLVPESPRWLLMRKRDKEALSVLEKVHGEAVAALECTQIQDSFKGSGARVSFKDLLHPSLKLVMLAGITVAILQQITGINAVFFYAPMIFEQSAIGADAAFFQAVLVGLVNLAFTIVAILTIDRFGRKPLLQFGVAGIAVFMLLLSFSFGEATYRVKADKLPSGLDRTLVKDLVDVEFDDELVFRQALQGALGAEAPAYESTIFNASVNVNATLVLVGILGFVACFAVSLGPVMWVLFSEMFPNYIRGFAISAVGLVNSAVSFGIQFVFPWELANFGSSLTFLVFAGFALLGLFLVSGIVPETKGKSLEELETLLVGDK